MIVGVCPHRHPHLHFQLGLPLINLLLIIEVGEEAVTVETVMGNMHANGANAKRLVAAVLQELVKEEHQDLVNAKHVEGSSKFACCTAPAGRGAETVKKLEWLMPGYFS